jgi:hypothetical protein
MHAGNNAHTQGARALARAVASNTRLRQLNLGSNPISDTAAVMLAHMVTCNSTLTCLSLKSTMTDANEHSNEPLMSAFAFNGALMSLDLSSELMKGGGGVVCVCIDVGCVQ